MYAVLETGGKQYKISVGQTIEVEKLNLEVGQRVELDRVLFVAGDGQFKVGNPTIAGAKVVATVTQHSKGPKVVVFKFKRKNRYRRKTGHRQSYTHLRVDEIVA